MQTGVQAPPPPLALALEPLEPLLLAFPATAPSPLAASTFSSVAVLPEPRWPASSTISLQASVSDRSSTRASCEACSSSPHNGVAGCGGGGGENSSDSGGNGRGEAVTQRWRCGGMGPPEERHCTSSAFKMPSSAARSAASANAASSAELVLEVESCRARFADGGPSEIIDDVRYDS